MKLQHRIATLTIVAVLVVSSMAACTSSRKTSKTGSVKSGFNAATSGVVNPSSKSGGVIRVGTTNGCSNWDPATTYGGTCYSLHRLLSRTLVGFGMTGLVDKPGNGAKLYGDLATGLGKANGDKTRWTYTLRGNLKFATGDSITSADIKYGFERMFATAVISGGPEGYYLCVLDTCDKAGTPQYKGPYTSPMPT